MAIIVNTVLPQNNSGEAGLPAELEATVNALLNGAAMLVGTIPLLPAFKREVLQRKEGTERIRKITGVLFVILLAATASLAINFLFIEMHMMESSQTYQQVAQNQYGVIFPVGLFLYGVLSPFAEEVVFRGVVYNRIKKQASVWVAILLSALLFGGYHGNLVQGIYGFAMGCLIAFVYECFGNFSYALLFHGAANVAVYTVTGSPTLYEKIMNPCCCIVFAVAAVLLCFWLYRLYRAD
ncbi:MAG: CPBP family intramembrane metalloprotease [Blautia sp.]|nr:CPBP family intramembrane metalloprotease [Lachnoclostridium sp.]MCM1211242.1 CPBP family intramembrane metalloprotease [Blautia sp.]